MSCCRAVSRWPNSTGRKSSLSSPSLSANPRPVSAAKVAIISVWQISASLIVLAFTFPGQRTMKGMRWPASHASAFMPRKGVVALWPKRSVSVLYQTGPLSLVKMTRVFLESLVRSRADRIWPTVSSTIATKSLYMLFVLPRNFFVGNHGVCGAGKATYRKNGCSLPFRSSIYLTDSIVNRGNTSSCLKFDAIGPPRQNSPWIRLQPSVLRGPTVPVGAITALRPLM